MTNFSPPERQRRRAKTYARELESANSADEREVAKQLSLEERLIWESRCQEKRKAESELMNLHEWKGKKQGRLYAGWLHARKRRAAQQGQEDLEAIVARTAGLLGVSLTREACARIAGSCRGTPRIANRLLRRVRDVATVQGAGEAVDEPLVRQALSLHRVDDRGLDASDRRLLSLLLEHHDGGPVGLETLAAALGEDPATLEAVIEPYLLQQGLLLRTPRGRMVTDAARQHLGSVEAA